MNYRQSGIKIKSNWFFMKKDKKDKKNKKDTRESKISKMCYSGLLLYINLFKFKVQTIPQVQGNEIESEFFTCISFLRKEMSKYGSKYTSKDVLDIIKNLSNLEIIKVENISRWDRLIDGKDNKKDNIKDDKLLHIVTIDSPDANISSKTPTAFMSNDEINLIKENYYIHIDLQLIEYYKEIGLNEKYFPLYCLLRMLSNNREKKSWMSMERMAKILGISRNKISQMLEDMNSKQVLYSVKRNKDNGKLNKYEHYLCENYNRLENFKEEHFSQRNSVSPICCEG